jgi:hypothetical protein
MKEHITGEAQLINVATLSYFKIIYMLIPSYFKMYFQKTLLFARINFLIQQLYLFSNLNILLGTFAVQKYFRCISEDKAEFSSCKKRIKFYFV